MTVPTPQDPARSAERTRRGQSAGDCGRQDASMGLRDGCAEGDRRRLRWDCGHGGLRGTGASMELWP